MKKLIIVIFVLCNVLYSKGIQEIACLGDFKLQNGKVILDCKIGYRTFGKLNSEKSNVIIYPTWFGGTSENVSNLIGDENSFVDSSKYFIICIDALGNGVSSSPSNSEQQPGDSFPKFNIKDMVKSQYQLLTEHLKIYHLYGAIGGSMGSMQVFEWIAVYPDFIDKALPYVCSPFRNSYDLMWLSTELQIIKSGKESNMSDLEIMRSLKMVQNLLARTPDYIAENVDRREFDKYLEKFDDPLSKTFTVDNWESQVEAMYSHDITKYYNYSLEETAENINSELLMIISKRDHLVHPEPSRTLAKLMNAEIIELDNYCGHLGIGCDMEISKEAVHRFFGM